MARWHLQTALEVLDWLCREHPGDATRLTVALDLRDERLKQWRDVSEHMHLAVDPQTGLIEQFDGYFERKHVDLPVLRDPLRVRSMQSLLGIEGCAATQYLKQPDVLMLQYLLPEWFTPGQVRTNWEYYDPRTDHEHGSSLGPSISAVMACRVGKPDEGYQHFLRAARADLADARHNAGDGIHGASAGGLWQAAILGFAGLKVTDKGWTIRPALPAGWTRLAFRFFYRGKLETIDVC
jgi:kojibiose phosphorylase